MPVAGTMRTFSLVKVNTKQSHHQLQDALDIGLTRQAPVHMMRFDI